MNANVNENENVLVNEVNNNVDTAKVEKKKAQKTTAKKSTKKESAKVEKKEIEKLSFSKLLETLDTTGLHTIKKENLYNSSIYADCLTDKDKKSVRRKIRNLLDHFIGSIIRSEKNETICKQFKLFYEQVYRINDFSVESLVSNNTDELKKENLKKMLEIVKKNLK